MKTKNLSYVIILADFMMAATGLALMHINEIHTLLYAVGFTLFAITCIFDVAVEHFSSAPYKRKSLYVMGACMVAAIPCAYLTLLDIAWIKTVCDAIYVICCIALAVECYHLMKRTRIKEFFNF